MCGLSWPHRLLNRDWQMRILSSSPVYPDSYSAKIDCRGAIVTWPEGWNAVLDFV